MATITGFASSHHSAVEPNASSTARQRKTRCALLDLPHDLFLEIADLLEPADKTFLDMTCRRYLSFWRIPLADLDSCNRMDLYVRLNRQAYKSLNIREKRGNPAIDRKVCYACMAVHPVTRFSTQEQTESTKDAPGRQCMLAQQTVRICQHRAVTLGQFRHLRELLSKDKQYRPDKPVTWECCHSSHGPFESRASCKPQVEISFIQLTAGTGRTGVRQTLTCWNSHSVGFAPKRYVSHVPGVSVALNDLTRHLKRRAIDLCPHMRTSQPDVYEIMRDLDMEELWHLKTTKYTWGCRVSGCTAVFWF